MANPLGATSTAQGAPCRSRSATLPGTTRPSPWRWVEPSTITSARSSSASSCSARGAETPPTTRRRKSALPSWRDASVGQPLLGLGDRSLIGVRGGRERVELERHAEDEPGALDRRERRREAERVGAALTSVIADEDRAVEGTHRRSIWRCGSTSRGAARIDLDEDRDPPRVRTLPRALLVRQRVLHPLDEAGDARRDLLRLPPVLHRQAEAGRHRRPRRALPAPRRQARRRPARADPGDARPPSAPPRPGRRPAAHARRRPWSPRATPRSAARPCSRA